jgi:hypothetical protein
MVTSKKSVLSSSSGIFHLNDQKKERQYVCFGIGKVGRSGLKITACSHGGYSLLAPPLSNLSNYW